MLPIDSIVFSNVKANVLLSVHVHRQKFCFLPRNQVLRSTLLEQELQTFVEQEEHLRRTAFLTFDKPHVPTIELLIGSGCVRKLRVAQRPEFG
jgi:polyhydroxyalkanoate synthesis regulator protein